MSPVQIMSVSKAGQEEALLLSLHVCLASPLSSSCDLGPQFMIALLPLTISARTPMSSKAACPQIPADQRASLLALC